MSRIAEAASWVGVMLFFVAIWPANAAVPSVITLQWQRRLLVMSASSDTEPSLQEQRRMVAMWPGAAVRDITVIQIAGDSVQGASDPAARLRTRFGLPADRFMVVLVGKDGHVALRSTRPITTAVLAETVDAMPMRQAELASGQDGPVVAHPSREQLTGAWRLISIETTTSAGTVADPFYEPGSTGLIVYDASGWMSVQISGPRRVSWETPDSRTAATRGQNLHLKAAAYDSYYAYFGTWEYDPDNSVMTHHVKSSVIPAESGLDYSQHIAVSGNRMTFSGHFRDHGRDITRTKVWERVSPPTVAP